MSGSLITNLSGFTDEMLEDLGWPTFPGDGPWTAVRLNPDGSPMGFSKKFELSADYKTFKCLDCGAQTDFKGMDGPWKWECECGFEWVSNPVE